MVVSASLERFAANPNRDARIARGGADRVSCGVGQIWGHSATFRGPPTRNPLDLSPLAVKLVDQRLRDQHGVFGQIIARIDIPRRTDPRSATEPPDHTLYGAPEGRCNGCRVHFPFPESDRRSHPSRGRRGGSGHFENLSLLCGAWNSLKGSGTHAELLAKLQAMIGW